jgi:hypothetical protein
MCDKFKAERKQEIGNVLIFNKEKLTETGEQYSFNLSIRTTIPEFNKKLNLTGLIWIKGGFFEHNHTVECILLVMYLD